MSIKRLSILLVFCILFGCAKNSPIDSVQQGNWNSWYQYWQGTPYRYGGTSKKGIDCSALVQQAYRSVYNLSIPRTTREQKKLGKKIRSGDMQIGDLLFFKPGGSPNHVGIYLGKQKFVHASSSKGVSIASLDKHYWLPRLKQVRRVVKKQ